jgi:hypothetical protein
MVAVATCFAQILSMIDRADFARAVRHHAAERAAKGFSCWDHRIALLFCQMGSAHSLREVCGGLATALGKLVHLGVRTPGQSHLGWGPATVREMLRHPIYRGEIVWNAHQKIVRGGTKKRQQRAEKDWIRIPAPDLQIVPDALWAAVQARIVRVTNQSLPIRRDRESRNLLTGLCRCAYCHGPMTVLGPGAHRRKQRYYACSYNKKRESKICANSIIAEQGTVEKRLLGALADLLPPHIVDQAIALTLDRLRANQRAHLDRRIDIERELSKIDATRRG